MLVSVVIPCYGEGRFLDACLRSVRIQTYADLDIIVIDDSGQGDSLGQALPHALADNRIRLFQLAPNCGLGACRNAALDYALADWVVFLDGDDLLTPNAINAHVMRVMELEESDADLSDFVGVYGDWGHIVETGTLDTKVRPTRKGLGRVTWGSCQAINPFIVSAPLVKKEALLKAKGFAEHTSAGEDFIAWTKLLRSGGWFDYTTETVTLYRQKASSMLRNSAFELLAVLAEVQKLYFDDFKDGVCSEELNEPAKSEHGLHHSGQSTGDVRNRPLFEPHKKRLATDAQFETRRHIISEELMNALPGKSREVFELRSLETGVWTAGLTGSNGESSDFTRPEILAVAESRAELIETVLWAEAICTPIDIVIPKTILSSITDTSFAKLGKIRFLVLDRANIRYDQYRSLLLYRDWGSIFDEVLAGFRGNLPKYTVLKSCGISALNWKPMGAARRYRLPRSQKLVQGTADEISLFSRGVSVIGSPVVETFARSASDLSRSEVLVLAPYAQNLISGQCAQLQLWAETITAHLDHASVPYRLASLDSNVAKDLLGLGCITISYRDMFAYPKLISAFSDELFFVAAAGTPAFIYALDDPLGGSEFLQTMGLPICDDVRSLRRELGRFVEYDDHRRFYKVDPDHLAGVPVNYKALIEALGVDKNYQIPLVANP